jgi:lipopolysaccharide export system ATP-binding protein
MSRFPIGLSAWIERCRVDDIPSLLALREIVLLADETGAVSRASFSPGSAASVPVLAECGLVDLVHPLREDGAVVDGWGLARLTPGARADLQEIEIEGGRETLVRAIDERVETLRSDPAPQTVSGAAPDGAADNASAPESHSDEAAPALWTSPEEPSSAAGEGQADALEGPEATMTAPEPGPASTLASRGLVKVYRKRRVVNEVDLYLRQGEIVGLLGPNGAGKTTTFYMVVGLIQPDRGKVYLGDDDVTSVPMYRRARRGIGYLAQEPSVFRKLTVEENVLAVLQMLGLSRRKQRERLEILLDELGIKHLRDTKAYALSGGERRRLEITRALVGEPKFMLLDEPFAGVDPIAVHDIQQIVSDLRRRHIGVLISDHNVEQTLDIVDRAYIMYDGRVRVSGTVSELVWNDEVAEIYLGPTLTARMRQRYLPPTERAG